MRKSPLFCVYFKVVIITELSKDKHLHKMLKKKPTDFPKILQTLFYVVFHNLESQNAGLVDVKRNLN